jgi:hypothetical protein
MRPRPARILPLAGALMFDGPLTPPLSPQERGEGAEAPRLLKQPALQNK